MSSRKIPFDQVNPHLPKDITDLTQSYLGLALETWADAAVPFETRACKEPGVSHFPNGNEFC